jgi:hypothetical protein
MDGKTLTTNDVTRVIDERVSAVRTGKATYRQDSSQKRDCGALSPATILFKAMVAFSEVCYTMRILRAGCRC